MPCWRAAATRACVTPTVSVACRCATCAIIPARWCIRTTRSWGASPTAAATACWAARLDREGGQLGYDHFEVVVDDATRLAFVAHVPNESAASASRALLDAAVWFAERGVRIERVMTDNAWAYTSPTFERAVASLDAVHKRTRPHRPQTNGKAERFIKTLLAEWAYGRLYRTNQERLDALPGWTAYYNAERTHTSLGGITPMDALLNNLHGNHT